MSRAEVVESVYVGVEPERAWAALTDWNRQGEWMLSTTERAGGQGSGARLHAVTGPSLAGRRLGVTDLMEIDEWDPPRRAHVIHRGSVIRGVADFGVVKAGSGSAVRWSEQLDLPLGTVGTLGWRMLRPVFRAGVRLSLRRFARWAADYPPQHVR